MINSKNEIGEIENQKIKNKKEKRTIAFYQKT